LVCHGLGLARGYVVGVVMMAFVLEVLSLPHRVRLAPAREAS
jgi:hypothetical protein